MPFSWRITTVSGIPIYLHGTFLILLAFVFITEWTRGRTLTAALGGALFMLAIFGTVVLHELGHALTARRFGIRTRDITLLPIGGIARLERIPDVPRQELWVALAGPAVNLALAGLVLLLTFGLSGASLDPLTDMFSGSMLGRFASINLWLAAFNLIPAFPMDGGRALRALLAEATDYVRATRIAARLGQGLALIFAIAGLFLNPMLMIIALFVWMGATAEAAAVETRSVLAGVPVTHAMMTDFRALDPGDSLQHAVDLTLAGAQRDFPVIVDGRLVGVLTREGLIAAIAREGPGAAVEPAMSRDFVTADWRELLEPAVQRLQGCACQVLPVLQGDRVVGLLTADNIGEFVLFHGAVSASRAPR
jgi:Zn-dependent protease/predicted transcriptional regulator